MTDLKMPKVGEVDVVAAQPKSADLERMDYAKGALETAAEPMTYVVKIELSDSPVLYGGQGLFLFVGDYRVEKYTGYPGGIYFKVYDPEFFEAHAGEEIRFSRDGGKTFIDTGKKLPAPAAKKTGALESLDDLPTQEEILGAGMRGR